jgi:hypothetical protein
MTALATDCVQRVLQLFEDEVRATNPKMTDEEVQKTLEKERVFLLPGKTKKESVQEMTKMLIAKLDVNRGTKETTDSKTADNQNACSV